MSTYLRDIILIDVFSAGSQSKTQIGEVQYQGATWSGISSGVRHSKNKLMISDCSYLICTRCRAGPAPVTQSRRAGAFAGGGHTLGSDEVESSFIPDPSAPEGEGTFCSMAIVVFSDSAVLKFR